MASYRFAVAGFVLCLIALALLLGVWAAYYLGPELSVFDLGSPQLRALA